MRYSISYNPARKVWMVWESRGMTAEVVKTFKTQSGAEQWVAKHS